MAHGFLGALIDIDAGTALLHVADFAFAHVFARTGGEAVLVFSTWFLFLALVDRCAFDAALAAITFLTVALEGSRGVDAVGMSMALFLEVGVLAFIDIVTFATSNQPIASLAFACQTKESVCWPVNSFGTVRSLEKVLRTLIIRVLPKLSPKEFAK